MRGEYLYENQMRARTREFVSQSNDLSIYRIKLNMKRWARAYMILLIWLLFYDAYIV